MLIWSSLCPNIHLLEAETSANLWWCCCCTCPGSSRKWPGGRMEAWSNANEFSPAHSGSRAQTPPRCCWLWQRRSTVFRGTGWLGGFWGYHTDRPAVHGLRIKANHCTLVWVSDSSPCSELNKCLQIEKLKTAHLWKRWYDFTTNTETWGGETSTVPESSADVCRTCSRSSRRRWTLQRSMSQCTDRGGEERSDQGALSTRKLHLLAFTYTF